MQLSKYALKTLGADAGAGSVVTETEFNDSQATFDADEKGVLFRAIPANNIGRGRVEDLGLKAEHEFVMYDGLKKRDRIKLNINYPKKVGAETRIYFRRPFKPSSQDFWFVFIRSIDKALCISSLDKDQFSALQKGLLSTQPIPDTLADTNERLAPSEVLERVKRSILARRGQAKFRSSLLRKFNNQCCVTGSEVVAVLEAAHIVVAKGKDINNESNGLLLRSEIHTIFDLQLLAIDPRALKVVIHPSLKGTEYEEFDGNKLVGSKQAIDSISKDYLSLRWDSLPWTTN